MATPVFTLTGIHQILWDYGHDYGDRRRMRLAFVDTKGRLLPRALVLGGFQLGDWYLQEGLYDGCDEVQVRDQNRDGAQLEFGRYVVRFIRRGDVVGEHLADSLERAG